MDIHKNARLTPLGRERMVNMVISGQTPKAVSKAVGVCPRTVRKWVDRFKAEGLAGLRDRSSRPDHLRQPTPQATVDRIEALRRQRLTGKAIAAETGVSPATVSRVLKRLGLNRLSARMGLCQGLRHITSTGCRAALLDPSLQLASAACQYRIRATHQHPRSARE